MASAYNPVLVNVSAPPRGGGEQAALKIFAQSMLGSFSWGSSPAVATLQYVGNNAPVTTGARMDFTIGGHYFTGLCKSDTLVDSASGRLRTLEFVDMRYFLTWDWVFGVWNMPDVRMVNGVRMKRYWHIYPADWVIQKRTFTTSPHLAWEIMAMAQRSPTVFTPWTWDFTSNGLFPAGLFNGPIYEIDCSSGMRLDAFLSLVCDKTGMVFCADPRNGYDNRLVFTRKGFGLLPIPFPADSDERRSGYSLTENPTNICVLGDRNKYQWLNVPMVKDWSAAWEQFMDIELFVQDIYDNETDPVSGQRYNSFTGDTDHWRGYGAAKARALELTVSQYIALRGARPGNADASSFSDHRKYACRWRMDMPCALYIRNIVFRAFKPNIGGFSNINNQFVPLDSSPIADQLLCRVYLDYATGDMTADISQPVDGNGLLAVKGYQLGEDLFRYAQPDRMNENFFSASTRGWSSVNFQIDDSGEGVRFMIADAPVFVSDNLYTTVDGYVVLNAGFTLQTPSVKAAMVFDAERYTYWKGVGWSNTRGYTLDPSKPLPGRNRIEPVNGLQMEFVASVSGGGFTEIPYANNQYADDRANLIATTLLLQQATYLSGGYNLKWNPKLSVDKFGTPLAPGTSSCFDRIEIQYGPSGVIEVVDFTSERGRDYFEPERELDRRTVQNSFFPGQLELRKEADDQKRFNAGLRQLGDLMGLFQKILRGESDRRLHFVRFVAGATLPATLPVGTPLVHTSGGKTVQAPGSVAASDTSVFAGVIVRHNEPTGGVFTVQKSGDSYARVQGPVNPNDNIGLSPSGGADFNTNGAYLVGDGNVASVGQALETIADSSIKLIKVRFGFGGGQSNAKWPYRGIWDADSIYQSYEVVQMGTGTSAGLYMSLIDGNDNAPDSGIGWIQISTAGGVWL